MNYYNVGDCLISKTCIIKILGKFSSRVYHVVRFTDAFSKRSYGSYNSYQLQKYFTKCESTIMDKAIKLITLNRSIVKNIVSHSKAKHFGKNGVAMNGRGYVLNRKIAPYKFIQIEVFYEKSIAGSYQPWLSWGAIPIYAHEYDRLLKYVINLRKTLKDLWQSTKMS